MSRTQVWRYQMVTIPRFFDNTLLWHKNVPKRIPHVAFFRFRQSHVSNQPHALHASAEKANNHLFFMMLETDNSMSCCVFHHQPHTRRHEEATHIQPGPSGHCPTPGPFPRHVFGQCRANSVPHPAGGKASSAETAPRRLHCGTKSHHTHSHTHTINKMQQWCR